MNDVLNIIENNGKSFGVIKCSCNSKSGMHCGEMNINQGKTVLRNIVCNLCGTPLKPDPSNTLTDVDYS